jgi:hypothetical protein
MNFAEQVVSFLEEPSPVAVNRLFCEVSIEKALKVCTTEELGIAKERQDQIWLEARQQERQARRTALAQYLGDAKISKETAYKIDAWAAQNPYARPVTQGQIESLKSQLTAAKLKVSEVFNWRDRLHASDRFGWDNSINDEDPEYLAMLAEMVCVQAQRDELQKQLKLALSGFSNILSNA